MHRDNAITSVILVQPQHFGLLEGFVNGLLSLANFVSSHLPGVDVHLLDLSHTGGQELRKEIRAVLPSHNGRLFVGITTTTASYQSSLLIARLFKDLRPDCVTILGGHHASSQDSLIVESHATVVNFVVRGEGELALTSLVGNYPLLDSVPNITYLDATGTVCRNAEAPLLTPADLDAIPVSFCDEGIRSTPGKFDHVTYVSARGCPLKCAFCAVANQSIRAKSVPHVIEDLRILIEDCGYRRIAIEDNFFAHSPKRTFELCDAIARYRNESGIHFTWDCQTRVESMRSKEILQALEQAGCEAVYLGVEALVPEHLIYLNKTSKPNRYLQMLEDEVVPQLMASTINCYMNLQLGLPGETKEQRDMTLLRLKFLGALASNHSKLITVFPMLHVVYPGTSHFLKFVAEGLLAENCFEEFTAWENREQPILNWLGRHFAHGTGGIPIGILDEKKLRQKEYGISPGAIAGIVNYLGEMAEQYPKGLVIFSYGQYLVESQKGSRMAIAA